MQQPSAILLDLIGRIVHALVDYPDSVRISVSEPSASGMLFFELDVHKEDVGKLIGRAGKTAGALRHVVGAASAKLKVRSILSIPDKRERTQ